MYSNGKGGERVHYFREIDLRDPYATLEWGVFEQKVTVEGKDRRFLTYIPDGTKPAASVVMVLGPNHCSAEDLLESSGWRELAGSGQNSACFIVFFLEPEDGVWNTNEPYGCDEGDVAYVTAVFAKGCERFHYCIHESKNYLYGVREGGCVAHMAAMAEPALYAGLVTIGAGDVPNEYCVANRRDYCRNLDGFVDWAAKKQIRKGDIPVPVWMIDDPERGSADHALQYWRGTNRADKEAEHIGEDVVEYIRTGDMEYPVNQDKGACHIWRSEWAGASQDYGSAHISRIWKTFLSRHQRWMADPGGSLRFAQDPVQDLGMEYHLEEIGGWMREWYVYVPESVRKAPEKEVPLVFALHGYSCTGEIYAGNTNWYQVARERGFILVHPTAVPGKLDLVANGLAPENILLPSWNFTPNRPDGPDEFQFFREMLQRVCEEHFIDRSRVYVTGHSQGSMMVQALALGLPELFAAAAPCSGVILAPSVDGFVNLPAFKKDLPVPIWMFVGQQEQWLIDAEPRPENAAGQTIAFWHRRNHLDGTAEEHFRNHWNRYRDRWLDLCYENSDGQPMLRYTQVEYFPHATMPEMSWRIWDEFFAHWSRTADGLVYNETV